MNKDKEKNEEVASCGAPVDGSSCIRGILHHGECSPEKFIRLEPDWQNMFDFAIKLAEVSEGELFIIEMLKFGKRLEAASSGDR